MRIIERKYLRQPTHFPDATEILATDAGLHFEEMQADLRRPRMINPTQAIRREIGKAAIEIEKLTDEEIYEIALIGFNPFGKQSLDRRLVEFINKPRGDYEVPLHYGYIRGNWLQYYGYEKRYNSSSYSSDRRNHNHKMVRLYPFIHVEKDHTLQEYAKKHPGKEIIQLADNTFLDREVEVFYDLQGKLLRTRDYEEALGAYGRNELTSFQELDHVFLEGDLGVLPAKIRNSLEKAYLSREKFPGDKNEVWIDTPHWSLTISTVAEAIGERRKDLEAWFYHSGKSDSDIVIRVGRVSNGYVIETYFDLKTGKSLFVIPLSKCKP